MTDLKPEDLVKLREIAEKAPGQDGWGLFAKGATLSISRNGAAPSQSIDMVHWSGFDGSSLRVKADRKALAKHIATFDPPTVLSLLADRARMEKALRDLIPLAQKWEFVESRQFSYGGGGSEPSPAEWGVEVSYQQTREAGPFEQFLADVEAFHKSADEEADPEHPEWLHDSQIARQALGASQ